jgi:hypothetical protein
LPSPAALRVVGLDEVRDVDRVVALAALLDRVADLADGRVRVPDSRGGTV